MWTDTVRTECGVYAWMATGCADGDRWTHGQTGDGIAAGCVDEDEGAKRSHARALVSPPSHACARFSSFTHAPWRGSLRGGASSAAEREREREREREGGREGRRTMIIRRRRTRNEGSEIGDEVSKQSDGEERGEKKER